MKMHSVRLCLVVSIVLLSILIPGLPAAPARAAEQVAAPPQADPLPTGASPDWWTAVQEQIRQSEYDITWQDTTYVPDAPAAYQSPNRAHDLRTYFTPDGLVVIPRTGAEDALPWQWGLRISVAPAGSARLTADGNRIEYQYPSLPGLAEACVNDEAGLRQEITLLSALPLQSGQSVLDLSLSGSLVPAVVADGMAVELSTADGAPVLRYSLLAVAGAQGQPLAAHLELAASPKDRATGSLHLVVDSERPAYPLTLSARLTATAPQSLSTAEAPEGLSTTANWTAEGNQADAEFGSSVSTAGDVNGDGYSDVIVGAFAYDNGDPNEGRVYVYHGSAAGLSTTANWTAESNRYGSEFGRSVMTAGDVNGDGYSDVIVGAPGWNNYVGRDRGQAYVYHGSVAGLGAGPAWTAVGAHSNYRFGGSVGTAGDVNGDGYGDVIVGAYLEGRAYVYHGSGGGLAADPAWTAESDQAGAYFGNSVGTAGDVNGDGYGDVVIGAYYSDNGQPYEGRAYVYHGSAAGLAADPAWTAEGDQIGAQFGCSVGTAGDVNGDGYSDVIVGAYWYTNGQSEEGRAYVYHGSATGLALAAAWTAEGDQEMASFGESVGTAGDVNGDGYGDVIVGAEWYSNDQWEEGRAYVYHGSANGLNHTADWTAEGDQNHAFFGTSAGTAGDVNGDGYADVIVGARQYTNGQTDEGRAYVYHGSPVGLAAAPAWTAESDQAEARFGCWVDTAGDVNGDGYSDVVVGAEGYDNGQTDEGRAYVYHGSATGLTAGPIWTAEGDQVNAYFGGSAGTAGDVNGDGYSDLIVGAYGYDNGQTDEGRAYVYYGGEAGLAASPAWMAEGDRPAYFGYPAATAGDVNGDGYSDVIVGAPFYTNGQDSEGWAFVYHGGSGGLSATPNWTAESDQAGANFGYSARTAGDVNGDGFSDIIVGAPWYDNGQQDEGQTYVYHGSAGGLGAASAWTAQSDQDFAYFGHSVGTAGDVNGDGYSDVVVGAYGYVNGQISEGRATVYHGSATGLGTDSDWTAEGDQESAVFGWSVGTAGDVNGDGYSDVIVGALGYDNGPNGGGSAFVYHGSAGGLSATYTWIGESNQPYAEFGFSVGTAGDVNGDGYSDIIVGAPCYDNGQDSEGRAYVYYGNDGDGLDLLPRQMRADDSAPIAHLGRSATNAFRLALLGRTPFGRGLVKLEWEVKPLGTLFDGSDLQQSAAWQDTGTAGVALDELVEDLSPSTAYHWRVRLRYHPAATPFQQYSRWITQPWDGWNEADLRIALPEVQFSSGEYSVVEGAGPALITATLSSAAPVTVTVAYSTTDGTAVAGSDYLTASGTLTFTPGVASQTFSVSILDDEIDEPAETVSLALSGPVQAPLGTPAVAVLTIVDDNDAPVAVDDAFTVAEDSQNNALAVLANDTDLELNPLAVSAVGAPDQGGVAISAVTHITYTPAADFSGLETFTYTVSDGQGGYDNAAVTVIVTNVNDAPVLAPIGDKNVDELVLLSFTAAATDADLPPNTLTFSLDAGAPAGASISATKGLFTWTPGEVQGPGVYTVMVRVTDNGIPPLDDYETIQITVAEINQAPVLAAIGAKSVDEGALLSFTAAATDPDLPANTLTFSLDPGTPAGASINLATGQFTWTPTEAQGPGVYPVTIRVTDNGGPPLDDYETIQITIAEVNQTPVLAPIGAKSVDEGALLSFTAAATDADLPANTLTFSLDPGAPAGAAIDPSTGLFTWTPTEAQGPGVYPATIRVTDNGGSPLEDYETIQITVAEVNHVPVAEDDGYTTPEDTSLAVAAPGVLGNDSDGDLPPNPLTAVLEDGPVTGSLDLRTDGSFAYTPTLDYNGVVTFTYYVSDGLAVSPPATVVITVTPVCDYAVHLEPSAAAQTGDTGTTITYTLRLTNAGECVDVLDVTVVALWPTDAPATIGPLPAGEGTDVVVTVAIPTGAGNQDVATVTFTSQGDGGVGAISVLTTTANVPIYRVYLPLVFRNH